MKERGISPSRVLIQLIQSKGDSNKAMDMVYNKLESALYSTFLENQCKDAHRPDNRARVCLTRWNPVATGKDGARPLRLRMQIGKLTQPCIHAFVIRCWRNGWVTARRMRNLDHDRKDCCIVVALRLLMTPLSTMCVV
ncbi:MAG: hypothetical protein ACKPKO_16515, partial [Candidatus Fonsibacter sp.]